MVGDLLRHFQLAAVLQIRGDAGRFDVVVQTLIETVMTGNVVLLTAFFV